MCWEPAVLEWLESCTDKSLGPQKPQTVFSSSVKTHLSTSDRCFIICVICLHTWKIVFYTAGFSMILPVMSGIISFGERCSPNSNSGLTLFCERPCRSSGDAEFCNSEANSLCSLTVCCFGGLLFVFSLVVICCCILLCTGDQEDTAGGW